MAEAPPESKEASIAVADRRPAPGVDRRPAPGAGGLHRAWIVALAGAAAMFCGLGLARFAFGMMLPSMSASLGLDYGQGGLLGLANMAG